MTAAKSDVSGLAPQTTSCTHNVWVDNAVLTTTRLWIIAEVYDTACEIQSRPQIKTDSEWIAKLQQDWDRNQAGAMEPDMFSSLRPYGRHGINSRCTP